jgi:hypothetical protein
LAASSLAVAKPATSAIHATAKLRAALIVSSDYLSSDSPRTMARWHSFASFLRCGSRLARGYRPWNSGIFAPVKAWERWNQEESEHCI